MSLPVVSSRMATESLPAGGRVQYELVSASHGLLLSTGQVETQAAEDWSSETEAGICLGFLLGGGIRFTLDHRQVFESSGTLGFVLDSREALHTRHQVRERHALQAVFLQLPPASCEALASVQGLRRAGGRQWQPGADLQRLLAEIVACPYQGEIRSLYLQGKSLELLAMTLHALDRPVIGQEATRLSASDIERLQQARALLDADLCLAPSLEQLARQVGMCCSRLTAGFRRYFGQSVTEYLQDQRLEQAWREIRAGRLSSSQAAYRVGYSPAYFSTLFKRRYGYSPRELRSQAPGLADCERQTAD